MHTCVVPNLYDNILGSDDYSKKIDSVGFFNQRNLLFRPRYPRQRSVCQPRLEGQAPSLRNQKSRHCLHGKYPILHISPHRVTAPSWERTPELVGWGNSSFKLYLDIFKQRYGDTGLLINAGDIFPDDATATTKNQILRFLDETDYDAVGLTDQSLIDFLKQKKRYKKNKPPLLAGNIIDLTTGKPSQKNPSCPTKSSKKMVSKLASSP